MGENNNRVLSAPSTQSQRSSTRLCEPHLRLPPPFGVHGSGSARNKKSQHLVRKPLSTKRAQRPKPLRQKPAAQKKPRLARPVKRSLKEEEDLEREERTQKTERLRKLRLMKEAANNKKKNSGNGSGEAPRASKE